MNASGENYSSNPQVILPAKGHRAAFVSQLFPGLSNVRGSLAVTASGGIAALTLRQNSSPYGLTTLPVESGTAPGVQASKTLLTQTQTGISATANTTVNQMLPPGFRLSGTIQGGFALIVTAQSGNTVYSGGVDLFSGRYVVVVPAGTFEVKALFTPLSQDASSVLVYTHPSPVQVAGDTTLDLTLPTPTLFLVSGSVSGMGSIPNSTNPELVFTTDNNSIESFISISNGAYQGSIPAGSYVVSLGASNLSAGGIQTEELSVFNIGTLTVNGNTTANFAVPNLVTLNGVFSTVTPWASLGGSVLATDTSGAAIDPFAYLFPPKTSSVPFSATATAYQMLLAQNHTYSMNIFHSISGGSPGTPLGSIYFPVTISTVNMAGNNTYNFTTPGLPGQVTLSGRVIDGSGSGVADVAVSAFSESLTGASNIGFGAGSTTDSSGNYSFSILSGTNYQITFEPPIPAP
jgi:hypothetical protein